MQASPSRVVRMGLATVLAAITGGCADDRPTRSECIIGYKLHWNVDEEGRHDAIEAMFRPPRGFDGVVPLAGVHAPTDRKTLYLQFSRDCDRKGHFAGIMMEYWQDKQIAGLPRFERIPDPIYPSVATIDLRSPSWRD